MTQTTARIKKAGKHFEIMVDLERALKFKKGLGSSVNFLEIDKIYSDSKKGFLSSEKDMKECFGTDDVNEIAKKIVKEGEVLLTQDYREEEKDKKFKQVIDFLSRNAIDPRTGNPHTPERIKNALEQGHINIKNVPIDKQINEIIQAISSILPVRISLKKIKITIPAAQTGKAYGIIADYKQDEKWLGDGSLEVVVSVPAGIIMDFYDKLNAVTHGSALTQEIKE